MWRIVNPDRWLSRIHRREDVAQRTWPLGLTVATSMIAITELVGTTDYEGTVVHDSNWGARYTYASSFLASSTSGVVRVFGVPVFEGAQGLGYRLPNFNGTSHASPLILFGQWVPTHLLSLAYAWSAVALCWSSLDIVGRSWNRQNTIAMRVWFTAFVATPTFIYLLYLDYFVQLGGLLGAVTIGVLSFHRDFRKDSDTAKSQRIIPIALALCSFVNLAASHPRMWLVLPPVLLWSYTMASPFVRVLRESRLIQVAVIGAVVTVGLLMLELTSLRMSSSDVRLPDGNSFDEAFVGLARGPVSEIVALLVDNSIYPVLLMGQALGLDGFNGQRIGVRGDFINMLALLAVLLVAALRFSTRATEAVRIRAICVSLAMILSVVIWMSVANESRHFPGPMPILFNADGWDLQFLAAALILVAWILVSPSQAGMQFISRSARPIIGTLLIMSIGTAVMFPIALLFDSPTLSGESSRRDFRSGLLGAVVPESGFRGRVADASRGSDGGCSPRSSHEANLGVSHFVVAARSGLPTVESTPGYRVAHLGVSRAGVRNDCDILILDDDDPCNSRALDFLNVSLVLDEVSSARCEWLSRLPSVGDRVTLGMQGVMREPQVEYGNFYVPDTMHWPTVGTDCVLTNGCLDNTVRTRSGQLEPVWKICKVGCWFEYSTISDPSLKDSWVILPARFDPTVSVARSDAEAALPVKNYRGLLAVKNGRPNTSGVLRVTINPDARMYLTALTPYCSLVSLILVGYATIRSVRRPGPQFGKP